MTRLYAINLVLFGILTGILVSSACGPGPTANAQEATTCSRWELKEYDFDQNCLDGNVCTAPEGWEPYAAYGEATDRHWLRRCAD